MLRTIQADENPPRAYEILQELRDISSMAMEYFDEKIVPGFKCQVSINNRIIVYRLPCRFWPR